MARIEDVLGKKHEDARDISIHCFDGVKGEGDGYIVTVRFKGDKECKEFSFAGPSEEKNEKDTLECVKHYL